MSDVKEHIGWLRHYAKHTTENNWEDMRLYALRQLDWLEQSLACEPPNTFAAAVLGDAEQPPWPPQDSALVFSEVSMDPACAIADFVAAKVFGYEPVRLGLNEKESDEFHSHVQGVVLDALRATRKGEA